MVSKRIGRHSIRIPDVAGRELLPRWRRIFGHYEKITLSGGKAIVLKKQEAAQLESEITKFNQAVEVYSMCRGLGLRG